MRELINNMNLAQLNLINPAMRLALGFEMAAYREKLVESLEEDRVNLPESRRIAEDYNIILEVYSLAFDPTPN